MHVQLTLWSTMCSLCTLQQPAKVFIEEPKTLRLSTLPMVTANEWQDWVLAVGSKA